MPWNWLNLNCFGVHEERKWERVVFIHYLVKKKKKALIIVETVGECNRDLADFCAHVITIEKQSANRRL
jgi:hypothetical protein